MTKQTYRTGLGTSNADSITLLGHDLASELLGKTSFGELAFWLITKRRPTKSELVMFEAVLTALADHGFTPTAIAARLTYTSAPDSLQGALAAGLLGGGSRFLGVTEDCANFLSVTLHAQLGLPATSALPVNGDGLPVADSDWDALATKVMGARKAEGKFVPGLGHPVHKVQDPRTPVLFALAREHGTYGPHLALFEALGRVAPTVLGKALPLNGAGVCGAVLADLRMPMGVLRGVALLARCAGLLGHLVEEQTDPIGIDVYMNVDRNIDYQPPSR
jgi:citrate synthase